MKNKYLLLFTLLFNVIVNSQEIQWKTFEIGKYKIEFPNDFSLIEEQGIDSYIGRIENKELIVEFDYGAFTNNLEEYENNPEYEVKVNTLEGDSRKIALAKNSLNGFTAIYILDENSSIALGMFSRDISPEKQSFLLDIFENRISLKTLTVKNYLNDISFNLNNQKKFIEINGILQTENFMIFNILGIKTLNGKINNQGRIDINTLKNGIYIFKLDNGYTIKFLKY
ncbi:T9SS type A sorting domain-containing protein [uncultured Polaribacter sp.]|uniref:T9SS type A sorting domain-containing protein n=1 Tax=uncultured Polaribacter sp. TaxID=174711 RepID=UPI00262AB728|nr:T9SS type A sorting domain-containing protein [uncultured Polaribacter sp.]